MSRKNAVTVDELNDLLEKRFTELTANLKRHFDESYAGIIKEHSTKITELTGRVDAIQLKLEEKDKQIEKLQIDLDDQINRGMRNNLIVKGIPEEDSTNGEREETRSVACEALSKLWGSNSNDEYLRPQISNRPAD